MFYQFDPTYLMWIALPTLLIQLAVQFWLSKTFRTWSKVDNGSGKNGEQVANTIFAETDLDPVPIEKTKQPLSDHYDPKANVVRLSPPVANEDSVAAEAVTAHELGHVQQYQDGSGLIKMRSFLLPFIRFSPMVFYASWMLGFVFNMTNMIWIGMIFFGIQVAFSLLTLPVEFDASKRGIHHLENAGLMITDNDREGSKKVLRAAALTYVAASIGAVLQFFYFLTRAHEEASKQKAREERMQSRTTSKSQKKQTQPTARKTSSNKRRR
jgi:Zn-dependent membrane protease YugP